MTWTDFVLRGTLVLAAGFAASFALARASAALRHLIWTAAFLALLAMPVAMRVAPKIAIAAWPAAEAQAVRASADVAVGAGQTRVGETRSTKTLRTPEGYPGRGSDWFIAYLAGLLLVAVRFVAGGVRTARIVRQARPAPYAQALEDSVRTPGADAGEPARGGAHDVGDAAPRRALARGGSKVARRTAARRGAA